VYREI